MQEVSRTTRLSANRKARRIKEKTGNILAILALFGAWGYFVVHFGILWGLTLGWLPAFVIAVLVGYFWPYVLVLAVAASLLFYLYPSLAHLNQIV